MQDLFHVSRQGELVAGSSLTLRSDHGGIRPWTVQDIYAEEDVRSLVSSQFPAGLSSHGIQYLLRRAQYPQIHGHTFAPHMWTLEFVFELVRQIEFAQRPSRFVSFFACGSLEDAIQFRRSHGDVAVPIYKVSGQIAFRPDMKMLLLGPTAAGSMLFARRYWSGDATASPFWEYLLSPPVMIHERAA
jgi:hypothetical protein